jgi:cytochrome c nitrite reductase small subunit
MGEEDKKNKVVKAEPAAAKPKWFKISIWANIVILVLVAAYALGAVLVHQSDTNPKFCATCHIMAKNVDSYLKGPNLDHAHEMAGVQCKQCHNYPVVAEITSGIKFITGNYEVDKNGDIAQRKYDDTMCTKCHISYDYVGEKTAYLDKNPHNNHLGELPCSTCHVSHGAQIDYCATCHDHGEQKMIVAPDVTETPAP